MPESNQHSFRNSILSRARLPVPPMGHKASNAGWTAPDYTKETELVNHLFAWRSDHTKVPLQDAAAAVTAIYSRQPLA